MPRLTEAARELRKKPCLCGKDVSHYGPHTPECPRYIDRSKAKAVREALIEKRHNEREGEWLNFAEFHSIDLFSFHAHGDWPDEKQSKRTGLEHGQRFHRRVAYEIKVSRADFRAEMRKPQKRAPAMAFTHQFFFATPPGLVKKHEIPEDCGLVEVAADGTVKVVKHAPIRRPTKSMTTSDVVALLNAKHLGPKVHEVKAKANRIEGLYKAAELEYKRGSDLLSLARVRLIREKGEMLAAGSEWVGPAWMIPAYARRGIKDAEIRVVLTQASVYDGYDNPDKMFRGGTVYFKACSEVEKQGDYYNGAWLDAGDFLIAFRRESEPAKVAPPSPTSLHHPPKLVAVDGGKVDSNIVF